ncbi:MAG: hypothetical protein EOP49_34535, partial [Sphingobacteriales bacterium]
PHLAPLDIQSHRCSGESHTVIEGFHFFSVDFHLGSIEEKAVPIPRETLSEKLLVGERIVADEDNVSKWPLGAKLLDFTDTTTATGYWALSDKNIAPGWYKIIVKTKDKYGEEVKAEKIVHLLDPKQPALGEPLVVTVKNRSVEPGQNISYDMQTGFPKIWLIHSVTKPLSNSNSTYVALNGGQSFTNTINAVEEDRGGINMNYTFVLHNRVYEGNESFYVPWSNKELKVSYETFRDKVLPGSDEKWTVKVSGSKGEKTAAEMLVSMYDASLDQFKPHSWSSLTSLWPINAAVVTWTAANFAVVRSDEISRINNGSENPAEKTYDALINNGWNEGGYSTRYAMAGSVSEVMVSANAAPMAEQRGLDGIQDKSRASAKLKAPPEINQVKFTPPNIVPDENPEGTNNQGGANGNNPAVQIRKNFNETAFFFPALTTDAEGNVSFSFTIPEALTQWKLMTLAHDKALASNYSEKTVITQKPLMVQPNAPRFIREGDAME